MAFWRYKYYLFLKQFNANQFVKTDTLKSINFKNMNFELYCLFHARNLIDVGCP